MEDESFDKFLEDDPVDDRGFTIDDIDNFIDSIMSNDIDTVRLFLEKNMDPNVLSYHSNETPLVIAAENGLIEIVNLLLKYGADPFDTFVFRHNGELTDIVPGLLTMGYDDVYESIMKSRNIIRIQRRHRENRIRTKRKTRQAKQKLNISKIEDLDNDTMILLQETLDRINYKSRGMSGGSKPCWDNYKKIGMKYKHNHLVPNCVKK